MRTSDFDYSLPLESIAQKPEPRGHSRLLRLSGQGRCSHQHIGDLPNLLRSGDLLVLNDTKVVPARICAHREDTGGRLELLLVEKLSATRWKALAKPGKRALPGRVFAIEDGYRAEVLERLEDGQVQLQFNVPIEDHLERVGHVPLPPYIRRQDEPDDISDYQTVYAEYPGAIAAPTAGLHFTRALLDRIQDAGIAIATLTLHVGIGTFKPVTADDPQHHRMEFERFVIPDETSSAIARTRAAGGRIVAVGTTVVRSLESAIDSTGAVRASSGKTDLFIRPGYAFRVVDILLTNFHLPRSTLLMLVCAFGGQASVMKSYREALASGYRFYSYGDCMLVERPDSSLGLEI